MSRALPSTNAVRCEDYGLTIRAEETALQAVAMAPDFSSESRLQELAETIETSIIPRLLVSQSRRLGAALQKTPIRLDDVIPVEAVDVFVRLVMSQDNIEAIDFIEDLLTRGVRMETVLLNLMAPTARRLGDMWSADLCDFVDVTLGLSRMQQILRQFSAASISGTSAIAKGRQALLVPAPGEQHTFGLRVVEEFLLRDGWTVRSNLRASANDVIALVSEESYDFVGFSLSGETLIEALASAIQRVREASLGDTLRVLVGGVIFSEHPELVSKVGADAFANDAPTALRQANEWASPPRLA